MLYHISTGTFNPLRIQHTAGGTAGRLVVWQGKVCMIVHNEDMHDSIDIHRNNTVGMQYNTNIRKKPQIK